MRDSARRPPTVLRTLGAGVAVAATLAALRNAGRLPEGPDPGRLVYDLVAELPNAQDDGETLRIERGATADRDAGTLRLPGGRWLGYHLRLDGPSWFVLDAQRMEGDATCALSVTVDADGIPSWSLAHRRGDARAVRVPVSPGRDGIVRLALAVSCANEPDTASAVAILDHPRVVAQPMDLPTVKTPPPDPAPAGPRPNVIVYLVDTLRADHLGCYGYSRPVSPHVDAFAREASRFTRARAHTSWTRPSVAALLTGWPPRELGVVNGDDALPADVPTLAERLRGAGYRTAAVVANDHVGARFGFARGFDSFVEHFGDAPGDVDSAERVNASAFRWLDEVGGKRPLFLYAHVVEPHDPYAPPPAWRRRFAPDVRTPGAGSWNQLAELIERREPAPAQVKRELLDLYDGEVATADEGFGALVEGLRARGLYDDSLIVFLSDHGEEFEEHGSWRHGHTLHEELLDVPLLVRRPGGRGGGETRDDLVQQADVFRSIVAEAGLDPVPSPRAVDGGCVFSSLDLAPYKASSVQCGSWKWIREEGYAARGEAAGCREQLFDLAHDPAEGHEQRDAFPVHAGYLAEVLRRHDRAAVAPRVNAKANMDPALVEKLKALGYVR